MCYNCFCSIVPPEILKELAKRGSQASKKTLNDTFRVQEKRNHILNQLLVEKIAVGNGDRFIYDSMNQNVQRLNLILAEGDPASNDQTANSAYQLSGYVRDYYRQTFNLNSINGQGMSIISNIHFQQSYNNAFWDGDEMTYGDGDLVEFKNFASAMDVVAHELTHGITQFTANLEYYSQAGALNEHFSDAFGTIIKQKYLNQDMQSADWLIGDQVVTEKFPGKALRSMKEPGTANEYDTQPAHMDHYYSGPGDNQGVHQNSGIPNKAFYLACQGIGIDDCAKIWYQTLHALWRNTNFQEALKIFIQSAEMLSQSGDVSSSAKEVIVDSFGSVGIVQTA